MLDQFSVKYIFMRLLGSWKATCREFHVLHRLPKVIFLFQYKMNYLFYFKHFGNQSILFFLWTICEKFMKNSITWQRLTNGYYLAA